MQAPRQHSRILPTPAIFAPRGDFTDQPMVGLAAETRAECRGGERPPSLAPKQIPNISSTVGVLPLSLSGTSPEQLEDSRITFLDMELRVRSHPAASSKETGPQPRLITLSTPVSAASQAAPDKHTMSDMASVTLADAMPPPSQAAPNASSEASNASGTDCTSEISARPIAPVWSQPVQIGCLLFPECLLFPPLRSAAALLGPRRRAAAAL